MALVLLACLLQDARARVGEANDRLNRHLWEGRLALGDWCRSRGLVADAAQHYAYVRDRIKGSHPYKSQAEKALAGSWRSKPDSADAKARDEHEKRSDAYAMKAADLAFDVYRAAKAGRLDDTAAQALATTLNLHVDHAGARKERDEVAVVPFGWVPAGDVDRYRAAKQSEHFALCADHDVTDPFPRLEEVRAAVVRAFGDRFTWPGGKIGIVLLKDADAFERVRASLPAAPPRGTVAFYSHLTHVVYMNGDWGTLVHEAVHAVVDQGAGAKKSALFTNGRLADAPRDYWVIEGLACWFATHRLVDGKDVFSAPDVPAGLDVAAFMKMPSPEFLRDPPRHYAIAQALVGRFMDGPERGAFLDFARDFYAGRGDGSSLLK